MEGTNSAIASDPSDLASGSLEKEENIKVVVRIRPLQKHELVAGEAICIKPSPDASEVLIKSDKTSDLYDKYACNRCFSRDTTQEAFFQECGVVSLLDAALSGLRACAFAFGQTGAGKTFTVLGSTGQDKPGSPTDGLIYRSMGHIFQQLEARRTKFSVKISCLEVYHEHVYDLFSKGHNGGTSTFGAARDTGSSNGNGSSSSSSSSSNSLSVREHATFGYYTEGCTIISCTSLKDAYASIDTAMKNRQIGGHDLNSRSNRSHCMTDIYIDTPDANESHYQRVKQIQADQQQMTPIQGSSSSSSSVQVNELVDFSDKLVSETTSFDKAFLLCGRMTLVDLAGSERLKTTNSAGTKMIQEAGFINRSLYVLGKVITGLARTKKGGKNPNTATRSISESLNPRDVPFRESKLTKLLLGGILGGRCMMVGCVTEGAGAVSESKRTLQFSMSCARIKNRPVRFLDPQIKLILDLKEEVQRLKVENMKLKSGAHVLGGRAMKGGDNGNSAVSQISAALPHESDCHDVHSHSGSNRNSHRNTNRNSETACAQHRVKSLPEISERVRSKSMKEFSQSKQSSAALTPAYPVNNIDNRQKAKKAHHIVKSKVLKLPQLPRNLSQNQNDGANLIHKVADVNRKITDSDGRLTMLELQLARMQSKENDMKDRDNKENVVNGNRARAKAREKDSMGLDFADDFPGGMHHGNNPQHELPAFAVFDRQAVHEDGSLALELEKGKERQGVADKDNKGKALGKKVKKQQDNSKDKEGQIDAKIEKYSPYIGHLSKQKVVSLLENGVSKRRAHKSQAPVPVSAVNANPNSNPPQVVRSNKVFDIEDLSGVSSQTTKSPNRSKLTNQTRSPGQLNAPPSNNHEGGPVLDRVDRIVQQSANKNDSNGNGVGTKNDRNRNVEQQRGVGLPTLIASNQSRDYLGYRDQQREPESLMAEASNPKRIAARNPIGYQESHDVEDDDENEKIDFDAAIRSATDSIIASTFSSSSSIALPGRGGEQREEGRSDDGTMKKKKVSEVADATFSYSPAHPGNRPIEAVILEKIEKIDDHVTMLKLQMEDDPYYATADNEESVKALEDAVKELRLEAAVSRGGSGQMEVDYQNRGRDNNNNCNNNNNNNNNAAEGGEGGDDDYYGDDEDFFNAEDEAVGGESLSPLQQQQHLQQKLLQQLENQRQNQRRDEEQETRPERKSSPIATSNARSSTSDTLLVAKGYRDLNPRVSDIGDGGDDEHSYEDDFYTSAILNRSESPIACKTKVQQQQAIEAIDSSNSIGPDLSYMPDPAAPHLMSTTMSMQYEDDFEGLSPDKTRTADKGRAGTCNNEGAGGDSGDDEDDNVPPSIATGYHGNENSNTNNNNIHKDLFGDLLGEDVKLKQNPNPSPNSYPPVVAETPPSCEDPASSAASTSHNNRHSHHPRIDLERDVDPLGRNDDKSDVQDYDDYDDFYHDEGFFDDGDFDDAQTKAKNEDVDEAPIVTPFDVVPNRRSSNQEPEDLSSRRTEHFKGGEEEEGEEGGGYSFNSPPRTSSGNNRDRVGANSLMTSSKNPSNDSQYSNNLDHMSGDRFPSARHVEIETGNDGDDNGDDAYDDFFDD